MPLNVIKVSAFSFFSIVNLNDTSELSGVLSSVLPVFFSNYKMGFFVDLSSMSGKGGILKDSKEDIFLTHAFQYFILFTTVRHDVRREQTVLRFNLGTTTQIPQC